MGGDGAVFAAEIAGRIARLAREIADIKSMRGERKRRKHWVDNFPAMLPEEVEMFREMLRSGREQLNTIEDESLEAAG